MKTLLRTFLFVWLLAGCLSRPQPRIASFLLQAPSLTLAPFTSGYTVKVLPIKVAAPYNDKAFIYRLSTDQYESDFYHRFLSNPGTMLTDAVTIGLNQGQLFKDVLTATAVQEGNLLLEITVTALYADYRSHPAAVLNVHAYLSHTTQTQGSYLLSYPIKVRVPMQTKNAVSYAQAMNLALAQSLEQLQAKIATTLSVDKITG